MEALEFADRAAFRKWLTIHGTVSDGVWLLFGKKGGPSTITAKQALEEALCFGWIDGQMQSLGDTSYRKYFARRTANSDWSEKNRKLASELVAQGRMTQRGMDAIEKAKECGAWSAEGRAQVSGEQIEEFKELIRQYEPAFSNLALMPMSTQRAYTGFYLDAKTEKTKKTRLARIVDRLNRNLKPM